MIKTTDTGAVGYRIKWHKADDMDRILQIALIKGILDIDNNFERVGNDEDIIEIRNISAGNKFIPEALTVINGVITLSQVPIDSSNVIISKDNQSVTYTIDAQTLTPESVQEGDILNVEYYYFAPAQNWFDDATAQLISQEEVGISRRDITGKWLWELLITMGKVEGELI